MSEGFKLIFAVCESAIDRDSVLKTLWRSGRRYRLAKINDVTRPVFDQVEEQVDSGSTPLMVTGLENLAFPDANQVGIIQNLNITRPRWQERFRRPVVFWLDRESERLVTQFAPDFYRFRSASIDFPFPEPLNRRRIWELRRRVERVQASPETKMRWWWEFGLRGGSHGTSKAVELACRYRLDTPTNGRAAVKDVFLRGPIASLAPLHALPSLRALGFGNDLGKTLPMAELSDEAMTDLSQLVQVEEVNLGIQGQADLEVIHSVAAMVSLKSLTLDGWLFVSQSTRPESWVSEEVFEVICTMSKLQDLRIIYCQIPVEGLHRLADTQLSKLWLFDQSIKNEHLQHLPRGLTTLCLNGSGITDAGLSSLRQLPDLMELRIGSSKINGSGLDELESLAHLDSLFLDRSQLDDDGAATLPKLRTLHTLDVQSTKITDHCITYLAKCNSLRRLDLSGTQISAQAGQELRVSLPKCRIIQTGAAALARTSSRA